MRRRTIGVVLVALVLGGCALVPGRSATHQSVNGLRTDLDSQGLVASYIGGSCDGSARLSVDEDADRIDLDVVIDPDPSGSESCDAVGHLRTVAARLHAPIGRRSIWSGGRRQIPFDGSRLRVPSVLPPGFAETVQEGQVQSADSDGHASPLTSGSSPAGAVVTNAWATHYAEPAVADTTSCRPSRGSLQVSVGAFDSLAANNGWSPVSTVIIGVETAQLWRQGGDGVAMTWTDGPDQVMVLDLARCNGDRILTFAEIEQVARALRSP